jgi:hypothetical protein
MRTKPDLATPEVLQAVFLGLFSAELKLAIASFVASSALQDVFEGNLTAVSPLSMRKYSIKRNVIFDKLGQGEVTMTIDF